jgi:hypothetical protein
MKKILYFLLILTLTAAMMAGCGDSSGSSDAGQPDAAQAEQSSENTEAAETTKIADTEGLGDLLSSTYVDMMKSKEYMMKYKTTMDFNGQTTEMENTMAVSGNKTAIISNGGGLDSTIIMKDDKVYMVDHASKTVMSWAQTQNDAQETFDVEGITYLGNGKEEGLVYEEYSAEGTNMKYYFDGKKLVKIAATISGQTMVMEIIEISDKVPASMFEIPAGYQVTEM